MKLVRGDDLGSTIATDRELVGKVEGLRANIEVKPNQDGFFAITVQQTSGKLARDVVRTLVDVAEDNNISSRFCTKAKIGGVTDDNYFAIAHLGTNIDLRTRFESNGYASYFDSGFAGAGDALATAANVALYHRIIRGLSACAAVALDSFKPEDFDGEFTASALLGLRYSF